METILSANVLWCFDYEVHDREKKSDFVFHISGVRPFHCHSGEIYLTPRSIKILGSDPIEIPLEDLRQLYLGYDKDYNPALSKNFGLFWQPLRLTMYNDKKIYLIIDYNFVGTKTKLWFNTLQEMLS